MREVHPPFKELKQELNRVYNEKYKLGILKQRREFIRQDELDDDERTDRMTSVNARIADQVQRVAVATHNIGSLINQLDDAKQVQILGLYYIDCYDWDEIHESTGINYRQVKQYYCDGVRNIASKLNTGMP